MSILSSPRLLFYSRLVQLAFAIGFLILIAWCNTHKGNWIYIDGPVALGVIATIFALVVSAHGVWTHLRADFIKLHGRVYTVARMLLDLVIFAMWVGTATLMIRPRSIDYTNITPGPEVPWDLGIAFTFVEIVFFVLTAFLVFKEHRAGRTGGASAAYV